MQVIIKKVTLIFLINYEHQTFLNPKPSDVCFVEILSYVVDKNNLVVNL